MMKRLISLVLCAVLLLGCMTFAQAETQQTSSAVDIVLLMDHSGSMFNDNGNDKEGYRLDAAQMVIALLGNNGSRVAFVPFAARVYEDADKEFTTIRRPEDYNAKMKECERLRANTKGGAAGENTGGTDFAEALAYAYNLLASRSASETNQPMIILLTDGGLEIAVNKGTPSEQHYLQKRYYVWNGNTRMFDKTAEKVNVAQNRTLYRANRAYYAEELLDEVVLRCAESGYPVYSVAVPDGTKTEHFETLRQISNNTYAGEAILITEGLQQLPTYFGNMFADRIGSSELKELYAKPVPGTENDYEVEFVIPNDSVMEANLFVAKDSIGSSYLVDPEGKRANSGGGVTILESKNFILYKLTSPSPYGIWKLRFTRVEKPNAKDANENISFNLLYNYDVVLHGAVAKAGAYDSDGTSFARGDELKFSARFWDNRKNGYSEDRTLYDYPDDPTSRADDDFQMKATYQLYRVDGNGNESRVDGNNTSGTLAVEETPLQFAVTLDMKKIRENDGYNVLPEGEYFMKLDVEGCGLTREVKIPFTLTDTPPSNHVSEIVLEHYVDREENDDVQMFSLAQYIMDADNDSLVSEFVQTSGTEVATLTYNGQTLVSTILADDQGIHHSGTVTGKLKVKQTRDNDETLINVTVNVISANDEMYNRWNLRATADGKATGAVIDKDTEFDIKLELHKAQEHDVLETDAAELAKVEATIRIMNADTHESIPSITVVPDEGGIFTYTHTTGLNAGEWDVTIELWQREPKLIIKTAETNFKVENHAPVAQAEPVEMTINFNALPDFLSFLGTASTEEERTLDMSTFFTDADNETLNYQIVADVNESLLTINRDGAKWVLKQANGVRYLNTVNFEVIAYDNDAADSNTSVKFEIHLVSLMDLWTYRGLLGLAALVAFIILVSIIRQIRKPKFPRATLGVREGNSDYDTSTYELMPSKKPLPLAAVVMTDTAAKFGISANALTNIMLVPVRSLNGSIGVRLNKKMDDVSVALTTKSVGKGKKPAIWVPGDSLVLNSRNNTTGAELNVVLFPPEAPVPGGNVVNEGPFDLAGDGDFGGFNSDVNAFGANDMTGSFGGLAPTDSFSAPAASDSGFGSSSSDDNGFTESFPTSEESKDDFGGF